MKNILSSFSEKVEFWQLRPKKISLNKCYQKYLLNDHEKLFKMLNFYNT